MAQIIGPMVINDGLATPVARSFFPERISPESSSFTERSAGVSAGFRRFVAGLLSATSLRPTNKVNISLDYPVLQTVNGVSTVHSIGRFKGTFILPDTFTPDDRSNMHAFVANGLNHAAVKALVKDLDPMY